MKILSIANPKGGVGKSTLTIDVAMMMAIKIQRLLVIDFDDQCNTTNALLNNNGSALLTTSSYHLMTTDDEVEPLIIHDRLQLIPGSDKLVELDTMDFNVFHRLRERIHAHYTEHYDVVLIDAPNAYCQRVEATLTASDFTVTPVELDYFSVQALERMSDLVRKVRAGLNPELIYLGVIPNRVHAIRNEIPVRLIEKETLTALQESLSPGNLFPFVCERQSIRRIQDEDNQDIFTILEKDKHTYRQVEHLTDALIKRICP